jgi:hypothetical protein
MNNNINLLGHKDQITVPRASQKLKLLRVIAVLLLFSISAASVILYILIYFSALPAAQQREQTALAEIATSHPEMQKIALIQDRLNGISVVITQRNQYDKVIGSVQSKMPPGLSLYEMNISKKAATVTIQSNSLDLLETFLNNVVDAVGPKKEYAQVTLNSIVSDDVTNQYSLTISMTLL